MNSTRGSAAAIRSDILENAPRSMRYDEVGAVMAATLFINLLSTAAPMAALLVYDRVLSNNSRATLVILATGAVGLLIIETALRLSRTFILSRASAHADFTARNAVMERLLHSQRDRESRCSLADLNAHLAAVSILRELRFARITAIVDFPFGILFLLLVGMIGGWTVALPASVCLIFILAIYTIALQNEAATRDYHIQERLKWGFLEQIGRGLHGVAAIAGQVPLTDGFVRLACNRAGALIRQSFLELLRRDVLAVFTQFLIGSVVIAGALAVLQDRLSLGGLAACTLLAGRALEPLQNCMHLMHLSCNARVAREELGEIGPAQHRNAPALWDKPPEVLARNCALLSDDGVTPVLSIPSMAVTAGSVACITGGRGSGKTAIARALMGLNGTEGHLTVGGLVPDGADALTIRRQSGYLGRELKLPAGRVLDVLTEGSDKLYADMRYLAHLIGLDETIRRLPQGYDTVLRGDGSDTLPEGLRQQIAICRILAKKQRLLIIDELDAALDAATLLRFAEVLKALRGETTVIMLTDNPALRALAGQWFVISDGQVVETRPKAVA